MTERHALLPLRAFLGVTFVYAGVDKLADPTFLRDGAFGSLATQLEAARGPFDGLLADLVPAAGPLGMAVAVTEIVVGIAALTGVLTRASAAVGAALCLAFGLTIGWGADPWYFGHDWPYLAAWTSVAIAGPGAWTVPELLRRLRADDDVDDLLPADVGRRALLLQGAAVLAGATALGGIATVVASGRPAARLVATTAGHAATPVRVRPRATTTSTTAAPATTTTTTTAAPTTTTTQAPPTTAPPTTAAPQAAPATTSTTTTSTTSTTAPPPPPTTIPPEVALGPVIAASADVVPGVAVPFTDPRGSARGLLVRRSDATVVAFDERCTHQGCSVLYIAEERRFGCPCHGSSFDADSGSVLQGPATARLPRWEVTELDGLIRLV